MSVDRPPPFFVGNHLALDFLNTTAAPQGTPVDWLCDGQDLVRWLVKAQVIDRLVVEKSAKWPRDALDKVAGDARKFRTWLRRFVTSRMGKPLRTTAAALGPLNERLARDKSISQVETVSRGTATRPGLELRRVHHWKRPDELLDPIVSAAAELICQEDFRFIRACAGPDCILLFLDRTKGHARRWCSMAVCGNRSKVEAHRARHTRRKRHSG
ncbi:MAG TPA: CGNR zinc finger domain-containing protein [Pirellulales bacterium]|nr:CGNR zinc finger domain-containing protein [Pirellulales bacterium]